VSHEPRPSHEARLGACGPLPSGSAPIDVASPWQATGPGKLKG
jgi:hypothetical protein